MPLELFVFLGAFLEEVISPIPSFVVMVPAGAAAQVQGIGWWYLVPLALVGAAGRLIGALILYVIADKAEDWLYGRGRKLFGVTHKQLEGYGQKLGGKKRDFVALYLLNAVPVIPTALLSLTCGFIKVRLKMFVGATFFGSATNALIYMSIGYGGIRALAELQQLQSIFQIIAGVIVAALVIGWLVYRRSKKRSR